MIYSKSFAKFIAFIYYNEFYDYKKYLYMFTVGFKNLNQQPKYEIIFLAGLIQKYNCILSSHSE